MKRSVSPSSFGFSTSEVGVADRDRLWLRGGFPRAFLATSDENSLSWRDQFTRTFVERDLGALGFGFTPAAIGHFWTMLSHYHGQLWNASEIAAAMGVSPKTVNRYLDALEQTFMVRRLQPWFADVGKRIVKSPKIYLRDTGILHWQQHIGDMRALLHHPKLGASWEGFVIEELLQRLRSAQPFFYNVHSGWEIDLLLLHDGRRERRTIEWLSFNAWSELAHPATGRNTKLLGHLTDLLCNAIPRYPCAKKFRHGGILVWVNNEDTLRTYLSRRLRASRLARVDLDCDESRERDDVRGRGRRGGNAGDTAVVTSHEAFQPCSPSSLTPESGDPTDGASQHGSRGPVPPRAANR